MLESNGSDGPIRDLSLRNVAPDENLDGDVVAGKITAADCGDPPSGDQACSFDEAKGGSNGGNNHASEIPGGRAFLVRGRGAVRKSL